MDIILSRLSETLLDTILSCTPVSGGDINEAYKIETGSGRSLFVKMNQYDCGHDMLLQERIALEAIQETNTIRCPQVLLTEEIEGTNLLLLQYIPPQKKIRKFWENFGRGLAKMHSVHGTSYGWQSDNYIGSLHQSNSQMDQWSEFYIKERLDKQVHLAYENNLLDTTRRKQYDAFRNAIKTIIIDESPTLIHGDLWSGNFISGDADQPYLIDPSIYYGHREVDIAMTRLFGGFAPEFYDAYQEANPLRQNFESRIPIYQLYYLLVHLNLFGMSYQGQCLQIIRKYI